MQFGGKETFHDASPVILLSSIKNTALESNVFYMKAVLAEFVWQPLLIPTCEKMLCSN